MNVTSHSIALEIQHLQTLHADHIKSLDELIAFAKEFDERCADFKKSRNRLYKSHLAFLDRNWQLPIQEREIEAFSLFSDQLKASQVLCLFVLNRLTKPEWRESFEAISIQERNQQEALNNLLLILNDKKH